MQVGDRFVGRDREVAQLELAIGSGDDGLRISMLSGPSGMGKTTLAQMVMHRATALGFRVALATGRAGSLSTPFVPWIEALPEIAESLAYPVLENSSVDMEQLGSSLVATITGIVSEQPLLLVFDDVQALDESSLALLPYATGITEHANLSILFIEQSDAIGVPSSYRAFINGLLARRVVQHLELGPMSDASIRELIGATLELDDLANVPSEIIARAEGNPWFAQELAHAWTRGDHDIPVSVAAAATARLNTLDDTGQDIINAIAVCPDGAYIGWLERIADQKPRQFVRTMEMIADTGLIIERDDYVSISHPIYRQALLEDLSAAMRRALHTEMADVIVGTSLNEILKSRALGYHLVASGRPNEAVDAYTTAARANELVGQLHESLSDLIHALDASSEAATRITLLKRIGYAAMQINDERTIDYWIELGRLASAVGDNHLYAYSLFQQFWCSNDGTAVDRLERAVALGADTYGWSARAAAFLATITGDFAAALSHDKRALELARATEDVELEIIALEKLGNNLAYLGQLPESISYLRTAVQRATAERLHAWALTAWVSLAESLSENLDIAQAVRECSAAIKYTDDLGLVRQQPLVESARAVALMYSGSLTDAMQSAERAQIREGAHARQRLSALIALVRAQVAVEMGDATIASSAVADAELLIEEQGVESWLREVRYLRLRCDAQSSDIGELPTRIEAIASDEPLLNSTMALWLARRAIMDNRADWLECAAELAQRVDPQSPLVTMMHREIHATVAAVTTGDVTALTDVASEWSMAGAAMDAHRGRLSAVTLELRAGSRNRTAVIDELKQLRRDLADGGAEYDANHVAALLRSLGTRSRAKSRTSDVGNLTKRELEIARLVASGMRNAEVAQQLFLAEKTIAAHLSNIYGKLEVRSRVQLTAWLQEHDETEVLAS